MSSCLQGWLKAEPTMTLDFTINPIGSHWTPMSFIKTGTERFSNIYDFSTDGQSSIHCCRALITTFDPSGLFSDQGSCCAKGRHMHWEEFII